MLTDSPRTKQLDEVRDVSLYLCPVGIIDDNDCRSYWNTLSDSRCQSGLYLRTATSQPLVARLQSCKSFDFPMPPRPLQHEHRPVRIRQECAQGRNLVGPADEPVVERSRIRSRNCGAL